MGDVRRNVDADPARARHGRKVNSNTVGRTASRPPGSTVTPVDEGGYYLCTRSDCLCDCRLHGDGVTVTAVGEKSQKHNDCISFCSVLAARMPTIESNFLIAFICHVIQIIP